MLTKEEYQDGVRYTLDAFRKAGIAVTDEEAKKSKWRISGSEK